MSRRKKETLSRRDFLKATGIMAGSVLLSACSEFLQAPSPTLIPSPTSTETPSPTPTQTSAPTSTSTPEPSPTPKPSPFELVFIAEGARQEMQIPFTFSDKLGVEVVNFENWRELPVLNDIAYLPLYHDALLQAVHSDGSPLVPHFPDDVELPEWNLRWPEDLNKQQGLSIQFPHCDFRRQPLVIVGGFRLHLPLVDPNSDDWYGGITILPANPKNLTDLHPVSALVTTDQFVLWQGLNNQVQYPIPKLGIPDDIRTNVNAAIGGSVNHIAFYMSNIEAYEPTEYKSAIKAWDDEDFPPAYFQNYPFISAIGYMSNQF